LELFFETFPETLKTVIFDDPSMVLAGPRSQKQRLFGYFSATFFKHPFWMALGMPFCAFWLPLGVPWEAVFEQKVIFVSGSVFEVTFGVSLGIFLEGSAAGADAV